MKTLNILFLGLLCELVKSTPIQVNQLNVEISCEIEGGDEIANMACHNAVFILPTAHCLLPDEFG
jgi:hypothetical protein